MTEGGGGTLLSPDVRKLTDLGTVKTVVEAEVVAVGKRDDELALLLYLCIGCECY